MLSGLTIEKIQTFPELMQKHPDIIDSTELLISSIFNF